MIAVPVFQRDPDTGEQKNRLGVFEFVQLPSPGDDFNIQHYNGRVGRYRVLRVAHEPLRVGETCDPKRSSAYVYVAFIDEFW